MAIQTARNKKQETKKKARPVMWTDICGIMRVYGHEFQTGRGSFIKYSTSLGRKNEDGDYENFYLPVHFPKDDDPGVEGAFKVNITKGFLSLNTYDTDKGKYTKHVVEPLVKIQEYEFADEEQEDDYDKPF